MLESLFDLYESDYPSLLDLHSLITKESAKWKAQDWREKAPGKNKLDGLIAAAGQIFDCSAGISAEELCNESLVLDLHGMQDSHQNFLVYLILGSIFAYRITNGIRGDELRQIVVLDEAKKIFDGTRDKRVVQGIPMIDLLFSQCREFGIGVIGADQSL